MRASENGLHVRQNGAERLLSWANIDRVIAVAGGQIVGDQQMVVLSARSGNTVAVTEAEPAWRGLTENLHLRLPGAKRAAIWQLELSGGAGQVQVYER